MTLARAGIAAIPYTSQTRIGLPHMTSLGVRIAGTTTRVRVNLAMRRITTTTLPPPKTACGVIRVLMTSRNATNAAMRTIWTAAKFACASVAIPRRVPIADISGRATIAAIQDATIAW
jgi:hypothetical protein